MRDSQGPAGMCTHEMVAYGVPSRNSPRLAPRFDSNRMSSIRAARSTALTMSCRVRPATATAVSASIHRRRSARTSDRRGDPDALGVDGELDIDRGQ